MVAEYSGEIVTDGSENMDCGVAQGVEWVVGAACAIPPTAPLLLATTITLNSVQLQWKQGDNGGAAVKGFLLAYRREFGEWEEISVERRATTYLLDGLRCGTRYQFRMAAFNKIGSGSASSLEVARTKGGKPIAPPSARFLKINSTSVHLILSAWQDADCPILYFVVESRRDGPTNENEWRLGQHLSHTRYTAMTRDTQTPIHALDRGLRKLTGLHALPPPLR
uniref:(California timema) hypothetical protein n=1 Tax=Timema californicum TaxID=61474 RepID=A0A7R9JD29_TIMCA|nr:unnamed protein product [Timema californicum]